MKLVAGREQISNRIIPVERGLFALVHEGATDQSPVKVVVVALPQSKDDVDILVVNQTRAGALGDGDFAILNARQPCDILTVLVGNSKQTATDLRLVALDKSARLPQSSNETVPPAADSIAYTPPPEFAQRLTNRLLELEPGTHLVRFAKTHLTADTHLVMTCLNGNSTIYISGMPRGVHDLHPGQVAIVDSETGGEIMMTLMSSGLRSTDFAGITIEPLAKILQRMRRRKAQSQPVPTPAVSKIDPSTSSANSQGVLSGLRVVWPNRPLGLDIALTGYFDSQLAVGQAVMTSAWIRVKESQRLTGIKCALVGVNRGKWEIRAGVCDLGGLIFNQQGTTVDLSGSGGPLTRVWIEVINGQGDVQALTVLPEHAPLTEPGLS